MYILNQCRHAGCTQPAFSQVGEDGSLVDGEGFCLGHSPDPEAAAERIRDYIIRTEKIIGLNACGMTLSNIDLTGKKFYGCNLQRCTFNNVHANKMRARMCMFDFSTFTDCDFLESNIQFTSFAGSKFVHVLYTGSDLIHNNFNGTTSYQSSFDDSDLYNSRFIKAVLINTSLNNCNLKKTVFYECIKEGVGFHLSNTREALLDRRTGGMMGDVTSSYSRDLADFSEGTQ